LAALLLSVASLRAADQPADESSPSPPWYKRMFGAKAKPDEKKAETETDKAPTREDVKRSLDQEQAVYLQRLALCSRLRQIAAEKDDQALMSKSDALEQQATDIYLARTKTLPTILEDVKAAEAVLDQKRSTTPTGSAASNNRPVGRAPNGRPIVSRE
jgi:hypothetical protein